MEGIAKLGGIVANQRGEPFRGHYHREFPEPTGPDGVSLAIYKSGSAVEYFLLDNEYLEIRGALMNTWIGGDTHIFLTDSPTGVFTAGNTVIRGTVAKWGGLGMKIHPPHVGPVGHRVVIAAPSGVTDGFVWGYIRREGSGKRKPWKV